MTTKKINVGINGLGRIGKCCFLQLMDDLEVNICAINATNIKISEIEDYLRYDSTHSNYNKSFDFKIINKNTFSVNSHIIHFFSDRNPRNLNWRYYGCEYLLECTGSFLTTEKCSDHNVDYLVISSPAKDDTKTFIYGVNEENYRGEKIVSGSSCTTNCLTPLLKLLEDKYGIEQCVFTTIHATTASQYTTDTVDKRLRTSRSIFNNIIPHTTGASSSVTAVLPQLKGKIAGTSVRVPVLNCSLLDVNIDLNKNKCYDGTGDVDGESDINLENIKNTIISNKYYKKVFEISEKNLVSCDFITTKTPTILDLNASINIGNGKFKFMLWYDNEWSYSAQLISLIKSMDGYNRKFAPKLTNFLNKDFSLHSKNISLVDEKIVCRLDLNVPVDKEGNVTDYYRIESAMDTVKYLLSKKPLYVIITSHFGRPVAGQYDDKYSLKFLVPILEKYLNKPVKFLPDGLSDETLRILMKENNLYNLSYEPRIYLLENLRFHEEETKYEKMSPSNTALNKTINIFNFLGNTYVCDAFGCMHRNHMSICSPKSFGNKCYYGLLVEKECEMIMSVLNNTSSKKLSIIGGNKIEDKLPLIDCFRKMQNTNVYVAGGLASKYQINPQYTNVYKMCDGYGAINLDIKKDVRKLYNLDDCISLEGEKLNCYDIGEKSLKQLFSLIDESDVIFWNGSLGVIENDIYRIGSLQLIKYLEKTNGKIIIVGGGETASLIDEDEKKNGKFFISTGGGALMEFIQRYVNYHDLLPGLQLYV